MAAVWGAFVQYFLTLIFYVAVAVAGVFAGKALLKKKKEKEKEQASDLRSESK